jgi:hypothetical protein
VEEAANYIAGGALVVVFKNLCIAAPWIVSVYQPSVAARFAGIHPVLIFHMFGGCSLYFPFLMSYYYSECGQSLPVSAVSVFVSKTGMAAPGHRSAGRKYVHIVHCVGQNADLKI